MEIKCVVTDDEPIARSGLIKYIHKIDFLKLIGECEDAIQLNELLKTEQPDLLFLDIEMPLMSGLELLTSLQQKPKVIITTAYEKYALKGYELDVVDYLLKPISFQRFLKSVNKVYDLMEIKSGREDDTYIFVKSDKQLKKIFLREILYVESMENYVIIHTVTGNEIVNTRLKLIQSSLPENLFIQIHRSYIVNMSYIKAIEGNMIVIGDKKLPVARTMRETVYDVIVGNNIISK